MPLAARLTSARPETSPGMVGAVSVEPLRLAAQPPEQTQRIRRESGEIPCRPAFVVVRYAAVNVVARPARSWQLSRAARGWLGNATAVRFSPSTLEEARFRAGVPRGCRPVWHAGMGRTIRLRRAHFVNAVATGAANGVMRATPR